MERYIADRIIENVHTAYNVFLAKVRTAIAIVRNHRLSKAYMAMCEENGLTTPSFSWLGEAGGKFRTSGIYNYFTNAYSLYGTNDLAQATSTSQPYRTGDIARNERWGMKNPNGAANFMTHPSISFLSTDAWSVRTMINIFTFGSIQTISAGGTNTKIRFTTLGKIEFINESNVSVIGTAIYHKYAGKNTYYSFVATGGGSLLVYANGILIETLTATTNATFATENAAASSLFGVYGSYVIVPQNISITLLTAEYNFFRALYPEIPSVVIGTQTWSSSNCEMVCTPRGNVIAEMQAAANVERITNPADRTFSSGSTVWVLTSNWTMLNGLICDGTSNSAVVSSVYFMSTYKFAKITITVNVTSGSCNVGFVNGTTLNINSTGTYTAYISSGISSDLRFRFLPVNFVGTINNISLQEIGWAGSQELYDGIYAQTAGTVEQKTYAAVKASAMWSHYNNDVALGAVYGKLYNWFAVKLMQMDIDYYNTANPSALWGWRVPTNTDFTTLSTTLGGDAVAGGKMKMTGLSYWNTPNTGATNESGFTALPGGLRNNLGVYTSINGYFTTSIIDSANGYAVLFNAGNLYRSNLIYTYSNIFGTSLRLIKN